MRSFRASHEYLIALGALAAAVVLQRLASPLHEHLPGLAFYAAVIAVSWMTRLAPSLVVLLGGAVLAALLSSGADAVPADPSDMARYLIVGSAVVAVCEAMRRARRRAEAEHALLEATIEARLETERALRKSEQRFRMLIGQVRDYAIFLLDNEGRVTSWNEGVERVLGYGEQEFIGLRLEDAVYTPEDQAGGVPREELEVARRDGVAGNDRWMRRRDGTRFFARGVTVSRRDEAGRLVGFAKIMRDETGRRQLEEELRQAAATMARANERQSQFLAMLSHELRNPLAPIRSGVEILRLTRGRGAQAEAAIDMISRQVAQLVRLIDDLLDVNRMREGKIQLRRETIDLVPSLRHALEIAQAQCGSSGQHFTVEFPAEPMWVHGDATRIGQVVSNLVHNACKFTPPGGRVCLSAAPEGDEAVIRVRDTGMGIPPDKLERIFGLFEQLDPQGQSQGGLGLGLSLARSLVEMHGGAIEARSEGPGRGSEFVVRLPLAAAPRGRPRAARKAGDADAAQRRVLVVDDNADAAESLAEVIRLSGHEVRCAHDGEEALAEVDKARPEVVLLDIGLPRLDGYEVARRLRARPDGAAMTLVAVTGWGQEEDVKRSRDAGFDAHVTKPVDYSSLAAILSRAGRRDRPVARG